jgi:outer membrane protein
MMNFYSRKMYRWVSVIVFTAFFLGFTMAATAQAADDLKISVGLGVGVAPEYEGADESEGVPLPFLDFTWDSGRYIRLFGNVLKANIISGDKWSLGPVLQYRRDRDDVDSDQVDRMDEIDATVEGGAFVGYQIGKWGISFKLVHDLSDEHDGMLATLRGSYNTSFKNDWSFGIGLSSTYADDDYMETYFSVTPENRGTSALPLYEAEGGIKDITLDLNARYNFNSNWGIMGIAAITKLTGDADDSPVVDDEGDDTQFMGGIMVIYRF